MAFLDSLRNFSKILQPLADQDSAYRNDQHMQKVFAANPEFAQRLYGAKNDQSRLGILKNEYRDKQQQKSALSDLARGMQTPGYNPQADKQSALAKYAEITGDFSGVLGTGGDLPANVVEYQYVQSLNPEDQQRYLQVKRAHQVVNLGDQQAILNPTGKGIAQSFPIVASPNSNPLLKGEQAKQTAIGTALGATEGAQKKKEANAPDIISLVQKAKKILPQATSGGMETQAKAVSQYFGKSTDASKVDRQLNVIGTRLTNYVPRFEGPQSDADVQTYKDAAGAVANTSLPYEDRLAALDAIELLEKKYADQGSSVIPPTSMEELNNFPQADALPPQLPMNNLQGNVIDFNSLPD